MANAYRLSHIILSGHRDRGFPDLFESAGNYWAFLDKLVYAEMAVAARSAAG
ncbi:MAG: hypothetical protein R3C26_27025 [Calditrichia bacterium]